MKRKVIPSRNKKETTKSTRKRIVRNVFRFIMEGRPKDSLYLFARNCKQHNPYIKGNMEALFDSMVAVQQQVPKFSDPYFAIKKILGEGDTVAVHTELLNSKSAPSEGGLRQVHLFRFGKDNKIVEYWDITQMVQLEMPNPANAF